MKIYYDTEFIEDGKTIDLISIGMIAEDGREYYAVSRELNRVALCASDWLRANVAPSLPVSFWDVFRRRAKPDTPRSYEMWWNTEHPDWKHVKDRATIADEVCAFIQDTPDVELWAWYAAYDHVALCQLWGPMIALPKGVPMYTNDLKQECDRLGNPRFPEQTVGEHNALSDARELMVRAAILSGAAPVLA